MILKTFNNGICYCGCGIPGCMSSLAENYDSGANIDDSSCVNICGCKMGPRNSQGEYLSATPCVSGEDGVRAGSCTNGAQNPTQTSIACCDVGQSPCQSVNGCTGASGETYTYCACMPTGCPPNAPGVIFNVRVGACQNTGTVTLPCEDAINGIPEGTDWATLLGFPDLCSASWNYNTNLKYSPGGFSASKELNVDNCTPCCNEEGCNPNCIKTTTTYSNPAYGEPESTYFEYYCCGETPTIDDTVVEIICEPPDCPTMVFKTVTYYNLIKEYYTAIERCGSVCVGYTCDGCSVVPCPPSP
jgi:hypothetical protein